MLRPLSYAALFMALFPAAASAQNARLEYRPGSSRDVRVQMRNYIVPADPAAPRTSPEGNLFEGARAGVQITRQVYREQDGSALVASGLARNWTIAEGVNAGVGLFSVTHEDQKEPEFRRSWDAKSVAPRNRRVAAVGVNVRF